MTYLMYKNKIKLKLLIILIMKLLNKKHMTMQKD